MALAVMFRYVLMSCAVNYPSIFFYDRTSRN